MPKFLKMLFRFGFFLQKRNSPVSASNSVSGLSTSGDLHIKNGKIFVNGEAVEIPASAQKLEISLIGNAASVRIDRASQVSIVGDVSHLEVVSADVLVQGNIQGNVQSVSGNVSAKQIAGKVSTISGNIS